LGRDELIFAVVDERARSPSRIVGFGQEIAIGVVSVSVAAVAEQAIGLIVRIGGTQLTGDAIPVRVVCIGFAGIGQLGRCRVGRAEQF